MIVFHGHIGQKPRYAGNNHPFLQKPPVFLASGPSFRHGVHIIWRQGAHSAYGCFLNPGLRRRERFSSALFGNSIMIEVFTTSLVKTSNLHDLTSIFSRFKSSVIVNNGILQTCILRIDMVFCTVVCIIPMPQKRLTCSKVGRYGVVPWGGNRHMREQSPVCLVSSLRPKRLLEWRNSESASD